MLSGKRIVSYRPGVAPARSAFECMASIYRRLQSASNCTFSIFKSSRDDFFDETIDVQEVPHEVCETLPVTAWLRHPRLVRRCARMALEGADLLLTIDPTIYPHAIPVIMEARRKSIPIVFDTSVTIHNAMDALAWRVRRPYVIPAINAATVIIATIPQCIERFAALRALDSETARKFRILGHPVDTDVFNPSERIPKSEDKCEIVSVTRLVPEKGLLYILDALEPILRDRSNVTWRIVGAGALRSLLDDELGRRGLRSQVIIQDPVQFGRLPELLRRADIFVSHAVDTPYWSEYFGAATLEAMACELPAVVTSAGAVPQVIRDCDAAIMIGQRRVGELRAAVEELVESRERRLRLAQRGRQYVCDNYSLDAIASRYHEILECALAGTSI